MANEINTYNPAFKSLDSLHSFISEILGTPNKIAIVGRDELNMLSRICAI
jgi:hypothetical protein